MVKGTMEIKTDVIITDNAARFKMGNYFLILEPNNNQELDVAFILDINGELCAAFNNLFIAVEYFKQVVNLHNMLT